MWGKKTVIVTGGKGFIGTAIVKGLSEISDRVIPVDKQDGPNNDLTLDTWQGLNCDVLVHAACNLDGDTVAAEENRQITNSVQLYLIRHPKTHLIFLSSGSVYPDEYKSMKETDSDMTKVPTLYGLGKWHAERAFTKVRPATILRLSNVYGEGGHGVIDRFKRGENTVHGNGMQVRDYIPLEQVVGTVGLAVTNPKRYRGIYNVSSGVGRTVLSVYKQYGKGSINFTKDPFGAKFSVLDNTKWKEIWQLPL